MEHIFFIGFYRYKNKENAFRTQKDILGAEWPFLELKGPLQHAGLCHKLTYQRILEASFVFHLKIHRGMPHLKGNQSNQGVVAPVESETSSLPLIFDYHKPVF